jgi:hypothetical protein
MQSTQLELDFSGLLEDAKAAPLIADWHQLCLSFDAAMQTFDLLNTASSGERLAIAADAILEMTEVFYLRASKYLSFPTDEAGEIIFEEDFFDQFLAEQINFDPAKYLKEEPLYQRSKVAAISKEKALEFAFEPESETATEAKMGEAIETLEYDENISAWAAVVQEWIVTQQVDSVRLSRIAEALDLSIVQLWLAVLLGEFDLGRVEEDPKCFYEMGNIELQVRIANLTTSRIDFLKGES